MRIDEVALVLLEDLVGLEAEHAEHAARLDASGRIVDAARLRRVGAREDAGHDARGRDDELLGRAEHALGRVEHLHAGPVDGAELGELLERGGRRDVGDDVRRTLVRGRVEHGEDRAVAVDLAVTHHRVVDGGRGAPGHEEQRQLLHLVERVKARLGGLAADEVIVVEPHEAVAAARERHGLGRREGRADEELVDDAHVHGAVARVVDDALDVAPVARAHREVREGLAVRAVLHDEQIERAGRAVRGVAHLGLHAVRVGARVLALDAHGVGGARGRAGVEGVVEPERGRRGSGGLDAGARAGRDGADVEHAAHTRVDGHGGDRRLDDGLHLGDLDGAQVCDVAAADRGGAGEREHRVGRAARDLHAARGAFGVAGEPDDAARRGGAPSDDHRVDGSGDLGGRGVGDVGEVGGREQHGLLEAVVDAQE